jgi:uncharacterized membrane protein YjjB (DUF3815 family)
MEKFDPVHIFGEEKYNAIIAFLIGALSNGIFARLFSALFLILALWFVWRKKQVPIGMVMVALSVGFVFVSLFFRG